MSGSKEIEKPTFEQQCRTIIEENRTEIYCFLPRKTQDKIAGVSEKVLNEAKSKPGELTTDEILALQQYGGFLFSMARLPEMAKECPTVVEQLDSSRRAKVYMRFPESYKKKLRVLVYLHGNGGQNLKTKTERNAIEFTKRMQEDGESMILIAPQDSWGNFYPEGSMKKDPGNWRDFNNPNTLANLIGFAESVVGQRLDDITLASFSGGNIGVMKILRSLESERAQNPEAEKLYRSIKHIAFFDSAKGEERRHVARWLAENPKAEVKSCYNRAYKSGNYILVEAAKAEGVDPKRVQTEAMKLGYDGHGIHESYWKKLLAR